MRAEQIGLRGKLNQNRLYCTEEFYYNLQILIGVKGNTQKNIFLVSGLQQFQDKNEII